MSTASGTTLVGRGRSHSSSIHGNAVVDGFQRLWQEGLLCDTQLVVQGQTFNVHRSYLAACSQYFFNMFAKDFIERGRNEVELKGVSAIGLRSLLEYAYTGCIVINDLNLQDVLEASDHLQFHDVLQFCSAHLREELTVENCLHFLKLAETYGLSESKRDTKCFLLDNLIAVAMTNDDFCKNVGPELMCELLADDRLRASSEMDVFRVALAWLEAPGCPSRPPELCRKILGFIRYGLMTAEQIECICGNSLLLTEHCRDVLQGALSYHVKLFSQPIATHSNLSRMRAYQDCLVLLGAGYLDNTLCSNMLAAPITGGQLGSFITVAPTKDKRYFAAVAVINDFVFVVGGQTAMAGDGSHATNNVFRYNPRDGKWLQISSMTVPRTHFALVALDRSLVAVGGKHNRVALNSAEKYDFSSNEWTTLPLLPHTLFSHAGCAYHNKVYISGGCPGEDFTDDMYCLEMDRLCWMKLSSMNQSRGYHVMVAHGNHLFVCAGNTNAGDRHDVLVTECYDIDTDEWTILSSATQGQSEAPAVKCDNKVFVLGGYSWDAHSFQESVQAYDVDNDTWEVLANKLPEPMTGVVACRVKMPKRFFEDKRTQSQAVPAYHRPLTPPAPPPYSG